MVFPWRRGLDWRPGYSSHGGSSSGYSGGSHEWAHVLTLAVPVSAKSCGGQLGELDSVWGHRSVDGHTRDEEMVCIANG